jgi:hypothetical protein
VPIDYVASLLYFVFYRVEQLRRDQLELPERMKITHFIFVHNPTFELLVISIMTTSLLYDVVDGEVLKAGILREGFAVSGLAYAWRAS